MVWNSGVLQRRTRFFFCTSMTLRDFGYTLRLPRVVGNSGVLQRRIKFFFCKYSKNILKTEDFLRQTQTPSVTLCQLRYVPV